MPLTHSPADVRAVDHPTHPFVHGRFRSHLPNIALTLLRVVTGLMFMQHGAQKFFGFPSPPNMPAMPVPHAFTQLWVAGVLELGGGALIVLGLFTRIVAFLLAGEMAVAYFTVHVKRGFFPLANQGELAVLYCFVYLTLASIGGGRYTLDHLLFHRREQETRVDVLDEDEVAVNESAGASSRSVRGQTLRSR